MLRSSNAYKSNIFFPYLSNSSNDVTVLHAEREHLMTKRTPSIGVPSYHTVSELKSAQSPFFLSNIFELARRLNDLTVDQQKRLLKVFQVSIGPAVCTVGDSLSQKYGMDRNNHQSVVCMSNRFTLEQSWFNEARSKKPQTFKADHHHFIDNTENGLKCDFCKWKEFTAEDTWGRIELRHAVTASNLFKYGEPFHGLVLFKHHDPVRFSLDQLADFFHASELWFKNSIQKDPTAVHPFFIWNCGPRAGASQFHGHGQLMLTRIPVPVQARMDELYYRHYNAENAENGKNERILQLVSSNSKPPPFVKDISSNDSNNKKNFGSNYFHDLLRAHWAVGLARRVSIPRRRGANRIQFHADCTRGETEDVPSTATSREEATTDEALSFDHAWIVASLTPVKDMEIYVFGEATGEEREGEEKEGGNGKGSGIEGGGNEEEKRSKAETLNKDSRMFSPAFITAIHVCLTAFLKDPKRVDAPLTHEDMDDFNGLGASSFNLGLLNIPLDPVASSSSHTRVPTSIWRPLLARLVCRGRRGSVSQASDYGSLEVLGGAAIGHTDPYRVMEAVDGALAAAVGRGREGGKGNVESVDEDDALKWRRRRKEGMAEVWAPVVAQGTRWTRVEDCFDDI